MKGIQYNVPLAPYTSLNIGGKAEFFVEAKTREDFLEAVRWAKERKLFITCLGGGKNVLISDAGVKGLVLRIAMRKSVIEGTKVNAEAGVVLGSLASKTAQAGLGGLEWGVAVPGTVGGAVRGNAGAFGGEIKDVVQEVEVWDGQRVKKLSNKECRFGYRESFFKSDERCGYYILGVYFTLEAESKKVCEERIKTYGGTKVATQPLGSATAGCTFKNICFEKPDSKWRNIVPKQFLEDRVIPAGWLIDETGLKGKKIGGISISRQHGNFFLNDGTGTAEDMIMLISMVKMRVRDQFGIQLQEEIQLLGFEE